MKRNKGLLLFKILLGITFAWNFTGCDRDYLRYDTDVKDILYLMGSDTNYCIMSTAELGDTVVTYRLLMHVLGMPKPYDRVYRLEWIDSATTAQKGIHYTMDENFIFPKDTVKAYMLINCYRDRDQELKNRPVCLAFKLVESPDFRVVGIEERQTVCHLFMQVEGAIQPFWWYDLYLGPYKEEVASRFMFYFHEMKTKNPVLYDRLCKKYGENLEMAWGYMFWNSEKITMLKYVVRPLYDYYLEYPDPDVQIPEPLY